MRISSMGRKSDLFFGRLIPNGICFIFENCPLLERTLVVMFLLDADTWNYQSNVKTAYAVIFMIFIVNTNHHKITTVIVIFSLLRKNADRRQRNNPTEMFCYYLLWTSTNCTFFLISLSMCQPENRPAGNSKIPM